MKTFKRSRRVGNSRGWLGTGWAGATTLIAAVLVLLVSVNQGKGLDDLLEALNELIAQEGPFAGSIAEEIPEPQASDEMAAAGEALSNGQSHTPDPEDPNQYAYEGPELNATVEDTGENINEDNFHPVPLPLDIPSVDVPTGAPPSPLFGAEPFTQQMLRFEEFGPVPMGPEGGVIEKDPFPAPVSPRVVPDEQALHDFLKEYITPTLALPYPFPTEFANDPKHGGDEENPWKDEIEGFIGRALNQPPAEGRPPGEDWAHQRWDEFYPEVYFTTAQTGARDNSGLRDELQTHRYNTGEFGPGPDAISGTADDGLYHAVYSADGVPPIVGTAEGLPVQFHPNLPAQRDLALWTWDGTFPPKLLMARYGEPILMRHYNALPIDPADNYGFGLHTITTHEHNGHTPAESDGYTQAFFFPGQFYDYRWPMVIAGHDSLNTTADDPKAGAPTSLAGALWNGTPAGGGITNLQGDWQEVMSTHWFHDHMLDFTATNVYKGNAAMMNYYSSLDRGNEAIDDGVNLRFPSGRALDWGNRDYDINLFLKGIAWDAEGQLWFNIFNTDGMLGDRMMTNWLYHPYMDVRARRYRFRILNGSVSRYFRLAIVQQVNGNGGELDGPPGSGISYNRVPFYMIANDGNIMEHAVYFDGNQTVGGLTNRKGILPTQAIAERYDIIVDFAQFGPGTKLYMVNLLEHHNGRRPHVEIPLEDVLDGSYEPLVVDGFNTTDTTVTRFLEFRVQACTRPDGSPAFTCAEGGDAVAAQQDASMNPADFVAGGNTMIPLPGFTQAELDNATHRTFEFKRSSGTDSAPWTIKTDGGSGFNMDPRRLSAAPVRDGAVEIWHLKGDGGWSHPIHVHFEEGQILTRGGVEPPEWEQWARKDVYRIGRMDDSSLSLKFAIRFREFLGSYMEHCHNTQHEDHAMLLRWDIENPGQVRVMPTPMPSWDGVGYVPSYALPTFRTGDLLIAACGDGDFDPAAEECDDGNTVDGDGCSSICTNEGAATISISLASWIASGEAAIAGSVSPADSIVSVFAPGTADVTGSFCTGTFITTLAIDAAGDFAANSGPGAFPSDPGEYCVSADNGKAASKETNPSPPPDPEPDPEPPAQISISLATWNASGEAAIVGSVSPADSTVGVFAPGTADATGSFCTGTFITTLPTDAAGGFAASSGPGAFGSDPGEYCVGSDNGKAASRATNL